MANIKQEEQEEELNDACSMSLAQFDIPPKHESKDIKVEPQDFSNMRSEFELSMPTTPTTIESKTRLGGKAKSVFSCTGCDNAFTTAKLLQEHTSRAHEGRKFPCSLCDFVSKWNGSLMRHERMLHRVEGKYHMCPDCNKGFTTNSNLQKHIRVHTGEKLFVCDVCAKGFSEKSTLKTHQRIHTVEKPYKCKWCDERFVDSGDLTRHERVHTGEKPYTCKWCDKRFASFSGLGVHERMHTGEKPYQCHMCTSRFKQSRGLRTHERTKHFYFEFEKYGVIKK